MKFTNGTLKVVGSILHKSPRDLDLAYVISDADFKKEFGITAKQWEDEGDTGNWSKKRFKWGNITIKAGKLLQRRILKALKRYPLDLKIIPESYDKKHNQTK